VLVQEAVEPQIIDGCMPAARLVAHTLISRFVDHLLHADETPVAMLDPGAGKTKKAYVWAYARGAFDPTPGVVYDAARTTRSSSSARRDPVSKVGKARSCATSTGGL
jgi:hypothetical protein